MICLCHAWAWYHVLLMVQVQRLRWVGMVEVLVVLVVLVGVQVRYRNLVAEATPPARVDCDFHLVRSGRCDVGPSNWAIEDARFWG